MSKKNIIIYIICLSIIFPMSFFLKDVDIFPLAITFSLYIIFISSFKHINIITSTQLLKEKEHFYICKKIFKNIIKRILITNSIMLVIIYLLSILTSKILEIKLMPLFLIMGISIWIIPVLKLIDDYLTIINYQKYKFSILNIFIISYTSYLLLSSILIDKILILKSIINNIILFSGVPICGIIIIIITIMKINKKNLKHNMNNIPIKEVNAINSLKLTKQIIKNNMYISIISIIKNSYLYLSIVYVYYILKNTYKYSIDSINSIIVNTYLYGFVIVIIMTIGILYLIIKKYQKEDNSIINDVNNIYNKILLILLPVIITIVLLSNVIWTLLFDTSKYSYILIGVGIYTFFLTIYIITIKLLTTINNKKIVITIMLIGLVFKIIFTPFIIDSFYRMGYPLVIGDIISSVISYFIVFIVGNSVITKKYNINLFSNVEKILNIIYNNIIYTVELILVQLIINIKVDTRISAFIVLLIYSIIGIILYTVRLYISKIKNNKKGEI